MTRIEFLAQVLKDAYTEFASDSNIVKSMTTGVSKNETDEQLILRALKTRKGTSKMLKFMEKHKFSVDIDFSKISKDGLTEDKPKEKVVKEKVVKEKKEKVVEEVALAEEAAEAAVEPENRFSEITLESINEKIKIKFIEAIEANYHSDSIMIKAINNGKNVGESYDEIICRIYRTRANSKKTLKIANEYGISNTIAGIKINIKSTNFVDKEIIRLIMKYEANASDKESKKNSVYDYESIKKQTITSQILLEIINKISEAFAQDSMIQKVLINGKGQNLTDSEIIIKSFKTRSSSRKMFLIAQEYDVKLYSANKDNIFDLVSCSNLSKKLNLIFTDKLYSDSEKISTVKTGKTLNELAAEKVVTVDKKEFSQSKDISEMKKQVFGNIIDEMFDKDALPYISEQLTEIFKNDTVVKKSFLTSEKNNEGLVGKIIRARKIRPGSPALKSLIEKIICDLDSIDDFKFNNVEDIKSESVKDANYTDLNDSAFKYQITATSITIYDPDGSVYNASTSHPEFNNIKKSLKNKDFKEAVAQINKIKKVTAGLETINKLSVFSGKDKSIIIKNRELYVISKETKEEQLMKGTLASFIIDLSVAATNGSTYKEKFDIVSLFLIKMIDNDMDETSMDGLFKFLKGARIPINSSGNILTYKRIKENYTDCHTGKIDNHVGKTVSMDRSKVTYNPNVTCASGLHVCSYSYLGHFGGARLVVCEVEPHDVVSVPVDYNYAKMRCCKYKVVEEITDTKGDVLSTRSSMVYLS